MTPPSPAKPASARHVVHGLIMGAADAVPGVSGGTMALILGIYEELLATISSGFRMILAALRGNMPRAKEHFGEIRWGFLVPLVLGIGTAIGIASVFVPELLESYPVESRSVFLGLVTASLSVPWSRIYRPGRRMVLIAIAFAVPAFFLSGLPNGTIENPALWMAFGGAAVAICAMILPGVSGSFLLLVLGLYRPTLDAVRELDIAYIGVFAVGAIVGLGAFATLLRRLIRDHHDVTMAALVGLMAGSLRALWPWQADDRTLQAPSDDLLTVIGLFVVGFLIVNLIQRSGARSRHPASLG